MWSSASSPSTSSLRANPPASPSSRQLPMKRIEHQNCHRLFPIGLCSLLFMAGCAIGPNYKRPAVDTPASFRFAADQSTNSFGDLPWWEVFKDPTLRDLIQTAVTNNYDLRQAVARVEQA